MSNAASLRRGVMLVWLQSLSYFGVEFAVALEIGSVSLFADSIAFLEDATVSGLILVAPGWSAQHRSTVGMVLVVVLLVPGIAVAWTAWQKFQLPLTASAFAPVARGPGGARDQSVLRLLAGVLSNSWGQPHTRGVPVIAKRCAGQYREYRCRFHDGGNGFGMA